MNITSDKIRELAIFGATRNITLLYKEFLQILEFIRDKRYNVDEETYSALRKRVLDAGNGTIREIQDQLNHFEFSLYDTKK